MKMNMYHEINATIHSIFKDIHGKTFISVSVKNGMKEEGIFDAYLADEKGEQNRLLIFEIIVRRHGDFMKAHLRWVPASGKIVSETLIKDDIRVILCGSSFTRKRAFNYCIPMISVEDDCGRVINRKIESFQGHFRLIEKVAVGFQNVTVHPYKKPITSVKIVHTVSDDVIDRTSEQETSIQK